MSAEPAWRLRQATAADAAALSLIASAAFLETYATALDGEALVAHCLRHNDEATFVGWIEDPASMVTIAEYVPGHAPIGYTVLTRGEFPFAPGPADIELRRIYTLAQTHGGGLGPALMARAIEDAGRLGAQRLLLGVWDRNGRARAFYEKHGFEIVGARPFHIGTEVHDDPVYGRNL